MMFFWSQNGDIQPLPTTWASFGVAGRWELLKMAQIHQSLTLQRYRCHSSVCFHDKIAIELDSTCSKLLWRRELWEKPSAVLGIRIFNHQDGSNVKTG